MENKPTQIPSYAPERKEESTVFVNWKVELECHMLLVLDASNCLK